VLSLVCSGTVLVWVDDARKVGGRSFQTRGPETAKLIVLVLGKASPNNANIITFLFVTYRTCNVIRWWLPCAKAQHTWHKFPVLY